MVVLSSSPPSFALDPQKTIAQYGQIVWLRQNGLPANAINVSLQTPDGYLWLGTSAGLFRFDGVSFARIQIDSNARQSHETISSLCASHDSSLWVGTEYGGLRRIKKGIISRFARKEGFFDTQVFELLESRNGHLFIGTSIGVYMYDNGEFTPVLLKPNYITALAEDSAGRIWIGTHEGVRIYDPRDPGHIIALSTKNGLSHDITTCLYADREANIWIGTVDGLVRWKNGAMKVFTWKNGISDNHVTAIFEDRDRNLWVGTNIGGLDRFTNGRWSTFTKSDGLTDNQVLSISEDHEGSVWVCTADGLNQFKDVNLTTFTTYEGLTNNFISTVIETPDKSLFFLSDQGSSIERMKDGKITKYSTSVGPAYVAHDGSLWVGQNGLLIHLKDGQMHRYDTRSGIPPQWISAITEDDRSLLMYIDHIGIFRFINDRLQPYLMKNGRQYPSAEYVVCFYPQSKDVLWIGTADSLVKIQNGESTSFTTKDGLAGNWVSSIYDDRQGSLWISSPQGGLTLYRNGKFTPFNSSIGLFTDEIYCVLGDDEGGLWLSSPVGIGHLEQKELDDFANGRILRIHSKVYTIADGMKTDECFGAWQPAGWKTLDGRMWFATRKGAVMIDPKSFRSNKLAPSVLLEEVVVNQHRIKISDSTTIAPDAEKFEFHYAALSFQVPNRVFFRYLLEGYDRSWVDAGTQRTAYYTNLPPGKYLFRVKARNNDGVWNEQGASFSFVLKPHYYQTYWFYSLMLIVLIASAFGLYRLRVWQLLEKEKELNARVQEGLASIKVLGGLIPICSNCKKIRNDSGYWDLLEGYIQSHSEAKFTHGICPDCAKLLYPDILPPKKNP
ncbi:MAG TPA: two-component regulator propeller domain-containing protein [Bacteroidota bacterium]|nr:two-component regulator propeller domain-containing protein [Bacteroidota bacterium]